ncbi:MAG TPA: MipA/OmpV family protein [Kiritimatiellia bacterium]|nr:MipA/OmpV family protein [Kiritimatiellia bacterium]HMP35237.1 MipA/OmpV family protein [Kiritimatiellia bacterium]
MTYSLRALVRLKPALVWAVIAVAFPAIARDVVIEADRPSSGILSVRIVQASDKPYGSPAVFETNVPAQVSVRIPLPPLPEGSYLVRVLHDANGDGRMNANAFGVPTESVARLPLAPGSAETRVTLLPPPADPRAWGAGVMTLYASNPYRGGDRVLRVLPLLTYVGEKAFVVGPRAGYNLFKNRLASINLTAEYLFAGDAFDDSRFLDGMEKRRDTLMAGADVNLRFGDWRIELAASSDVLGRHDGQEVELSVGRMFRGARGSITPSAGVFWRSSNYNNYYYGVRADEATDSRPAYDPGASVDGFLALFGRWQFNDRWSLLASLRGEWLSEDIQDSPIVDAEFVTTTFLGLNYAF